MLTGWKLRTKLPSPFHDRQDPVTTWQPSPTLRPGPALASARCHVSSTAATRCARRRRPRSRRRWRRWTTARLARPPAAGAQRQGFVGVLVPYFDEPSSYQRLRGIVQSLQLHGLEIVLYNVDAPDRARAACWKFHGTSSTGLIIISLPLRSDEGDRLARGAVPDRAGRHLAPGVAERRHRRPQRRSDRDRVPAVARPRAHRVHRRAGAQPVRLRVEPQPRGRLRRARSPTPASRSIAGT